MSAAVPHPEMITRACPVCGASQTIDWMQKVSLRLVRCLRCSMIFANPVPTSFASGAYYDEEAGGYYLSPEKLQSDYADVRFKRELALFRRFCPRGRVLDVGCSSGAFLFQLRRRFEGDYEVVGTDASGPALDYAEQQGVPVRRGNFLELQFEKQFDAITFWAVLEHVLNPGPFLAHAADVLHANGLCFVLVPNNASMAAKVLGSKYRYVYAQHLNYFTSSTLERLARPHFELMARRFTHFNPLVIWQDWRGRGREVSNEERGRLLQRTTQYKQSSSLGLRIAKSAYKLAEGSLAKLGLADNLVLVLRKSQKAQERQANPGT